MAATTFKSSGIGGAENNLRPANTSSSTITPASSSGFVEGGHQLEKLEFALAVAITRGDRTRSDSLREQIAELGGNVEEPGT